MALALGAVATARAHLPQVAPSLPQGAASLVPDAYAMGSGELRWLGVPLYRGQLWSAAGTFSFDAPFALDLHYLRDFDGTRIAQRSVDEMRAIGAGNAADLARWGEAMARIFPDVRTGDRIVGVHLPGRGARFFHNGRAIGEIAEASFARAFFGIWLDPRTSRPDFRRQLLGRP